MWFFRPAFWVGIVVMLRLLPTVQIYYAHILRGLWQSVLAWRIRLGWQASPARRLRFVSFGDHLAM
jgi:hypothetical protein